MTACVTSGEGRRRVAIVYGTRPELVKVAPLWQALRDHARLQPRLISTGQHRDLLAELHAWFGMTPDVDLRVMVDGQGLAGLTARVVTALVDELERECPSAVVVHGDTTTSMAAALAAKYVDVPVVHLEAGLRTNDLRSPFPEELNRRLTAVMADLHLAPTDQAYRNLLAEGVDPSTVVVTGNTVVDALLHTAQRGPTVSDQRVRQAIASSGKLVVATLHRRESHGAPLRRVAEALVELTRRHAGLTVILPLHPSPSVLSSIVDVLEDCPDVILSAPLPYPEFVSLMNHADLIITDSGGIQEEAPSLGKPVLVVRDTTERPEAVQAGTARVVGTDPPLLIAEAGRLLDDEEAYRSMASVRNPFGDGRAALRSVAAIEWLCQDRAPSHEVVVAGPLACADGL